MLQQLSHFMWELVGFGSEDENSKISMVTCIKWLLSYYKAATVAIQLDGKHIKSTPNLLAQPSIQGQLLANMVDWWVS